MYVAECSEQLHRVIAQRTNIDLCLCHISMQILNKTFAIYNLIFLKYKQPIENDYDYQILL